MSFNCVTENDLYTLMQFAWIAIIQTIQFIDSHTVHDEVERTPISK